MYDKHDDDDGEKGWWWCKVGLLMQHSSWAEVRQVGR
jgi:hypothetical protein